MIKFVKGDIFKSQMRVLVNPVNVVGVMGKGLALEFKRKYPEVFLAYREDCKQGKLKIGCPKLYGDVLCFPTKRHWRDQAELSNIEEGLKFFVEHCEGVDSIAFPKLGCGLGGLSWDDVKLVMVKYLQDLPIEIEVYE